MTQAGPPKTIEPQTLWEKLTQMQRPHKEVAYPRKLPNGEMITDKIWIVVLTAAELMSARTAAAVFAKEIFSKQAPDLAVSGNAGYEEIRKNECVIELLCRACRDPGKINQFFFPSPTMARQYVTDDEWTALFQAYCDHQLESGPIVAQMDKATMDAWIDRLVEGGRSDPLELLSSEARRELLMHSVARLRTLQTASGSPGAQPGSSSTNPGQANPLLSESERQPPPGPILGDGET